MNYAIRGSDIGQDSCLAVLPASYKRTEKTTGVSCPYTVKDVLTRFYGVDMGLALENYVKTEQVNIRKAGMPANSDNYRLLKWNYYKTYSAIDQPVEGTAVDFMVCGTVEGDTPTRTVSKCICFKIRYILDMRPCHRSCMGPLIFVGDDHKEESVFGNNAIPTDEYLSPIIYKKDYENIAQKLIQSYFPEAKQRIGNFTVKAEELAKRMGLRIIDVSFSDKTIMGQIYYDIADVALIDENGNEYKYIVMPGTILISKDNCITEAIRNSTIVHECCHMYLDRWFFLLQLMIGSPFAAYTSRRKITNYEKKTSLDWMEYHCEKLPAYILMEKESANNYILKELNKHPSFTSVDSIRYTIDAVSEHFEISKSMAKYRMIELGIYGAEGVNCFIDGQIIPDHGCINGWPEGVTYTLSIDDALDFIVKNPAFAQLVHDGIYIYIEGHFCLNDRKYFILYENGKLMLNTYARNHIDECCLAFKVYGNRSSGSFQTGVAARGVTKPVTKKYRSEYQLAEEAGTGAYCRENSIFADDSWLWGELYYKLPSDFKEAVLMIMKEKGITQGSLALELGVDRKVVYNFLNSNRVSLEHVIGVCVALQVPYPIAEKLVELSGNAFMKRESHHLYRAFLMQSGKITLARCNDILVSKKLSKLFQGTPDT